MTRLHTEYQRLYLHPGAGVDDTAHLRLTDSDGRVRAMVLALGHPADWATLSPVWRGVQAELALPAPAIAVNGVDAFELWFSLAQPVSAAEAAAFLQGLRQRYLAGVKPGRLRMLPAPDASAPPAVQAAAWVPALQAATGQWSAFVAPDLAAVFGDAPSLDFQPGNDAQAELLSRLASTPPDAFEAALAQLQPAAPQQAPAAPAPSEPVAPPAPGGPAHAALAGPYQDPQSFLRDVMNDPTVALALRIEAAKALLPRGAHGAA